MSECAAARGLSEAGWWSRKRYLVPLGTSYWQLRPIRSDIDGPDAVTFTLISHFCLHLLKLKSQKFTCFICVSFVAIFKALYSSVKWHQVWLLGGKALKIRSMLSWLKGSWCLSSKLSDLYWIGIREMACFICSVTLETEAHISSVQRQSNRICSSSYSSCRNYLEYLNHV